MQIQTVFKAGNSDVVAIPKHISNETGISAGKKVMVEKVSDGIMIKEVKKEKKTKRANSSKDFQKWLDLFMEENGEILDELASR